MTQSGLSDGSHAGSNPDAALLTPAQCAMFHQDDRGAARNIVCLMGGIFIIGIFLYLTICWIVADSPNYFRG